MRVMAGKWMLAMMAAALLLAGCGCQECRQDPTAKGMTYCGKYRCVKGSEKKCVSCAKFYDMKDPCADGTCTAAEREEYTKLGYACAWNLGMVPLSPKYNLPAVDCPMVYSVAPEAICPPSCVELAQAEAAEAPQKGFLMTAYDTPQGTRYVMVEAEHEYDPKISFSDVASDLSGVARKLQSSPGAVAVYLTEFPLINAGQGQASRQPKDAEVELIRQSVTGLGKPGEQVKFVRWK